MMRETSTKKYYPRVFLILVSGNSPLETRVILPCSSAVETIILILRDPVSDALRDLLPASGEGAASCWVDLLERLADNSSRSK